MSDDILKGGVWVSVENSEGRRFAKWKRSSLWVPDGRVFMPAAIWMDERAAILCASHDGNQTLVMDKGHVYVSSDWLANEFPKYAEDIRSIADNIRRHVHEEAAT